MTYYYRTKQEALAAGAKYEEYFDVYSAMEPYNGHVIKLIPKSIEVLKLPLADLLEECELDLTKFGLIRKPPADRVRVPRLEQQQQQQQKSRAPAEGGKPSPSGATGKVWLIADRVYGQSGLDRKAIIDACIAEGINPATAGTQYSKWKKAKGL